MRTKFKRHLFSKSLYFFTFLSFRTFAQRSDTTQLKLVTQTYFNCFTFALPNNLTRTSDPADESWTKIIVYANDKDSIDVMIRQKVESAKLVDIKKLGETMATSFYNGVIQKSEIQSINGKDVLVLLMTGHWNGAKTQSTWLKCFIASHGLTYQFLIRFPKDYKKYSLEISFC